MQNTTRNIGTVTMINNDVNGNPRHVLHYLALLTTAEQESSFLTRCGVNYNLASMRAKTVGGRKYSAKIYGGGIVFQGCEGVLPRTIEQAFTFFESSKVWLDAQNQIVLTIATDFKRHHVCLSLMKDCLNAKIDQHQAFAGIMHECQQTADKMRKQFNVRVSKDAVWLAAIYVSMQMEETANDE